MATHDTERATLVCAPAACIAFVAMYIIAVSEDSEYVLFDSYLSDLGVGQGAWAFNSAAIVAGFLLAVFAVGGFRSYIGENSVMKVGGMFLTLSGTFLMCVGIFTEDAGDTHLFVSYAFFLSAYVSLALIGVGRFAVNRSPSDPMVFISAAVFAIVIVTVVLSGVDPFAEIIAVFALLTWGSTVPLAIARRSDSSKRKIPMDNDS